MYNVYAMYLEFYVTALDTRGLYQQCQLEQCRILDFWDGCLNKNCTKWLGQNVITYEKQYETKVQALLKNCRKNGKGKKIYLYFYRILSWQNVNIQTFRTVPGLDNERGQVGQCPFWSDSILSKPSS